MPGAAVYTAKLMMWGQLGYQTFWASVVYIYADSRTLRAQFSTVTPDERSACNGEFNIFSEYLNSC
jgi:hypothetical protein